MNDIKSNFSFKLTPYQGTEKNESNQKGLFRLPNGRLYQVDRIRMVVGQKDLHVTGGPYSPQQIAVVKGIIDEIFKGNEKESAKNFEKIIGAAAAKKAKLILHPQKDTAAKEKINVSLSKGLIKEMNTLFDHTKRAEATFAPPPRTVAETTTSVDRIATEALDKIEGGKQILSCDLTLTGPNKLIDKSMEPIRQDYITNKTRYATEVVTNTPTIENDIAFLQSTIEHLKEKLETTPENEDLANKIVFFEKELANVQDYQRNGVNWLSSNYFRDILSETQNYEEGCQSYVPAPIDMHYEKLYHAGKNKKITGFYRLGVISDMRNGWVSITDLNTIQKQLKRGKTFLLDKRIKSINSRIKDEKLEGNELLSAQYALKQLNQLKKKSEKISPQKIIQQQIDARRQATDRQMIQLISGQVEQNFDKIQKMLNSKVKNKHFDLLHVGLLNQKRSKMEKGGWMHDERVEMEDMYETFKAFNGYTLVFDGKGPLIDRDNKKIHLPLKGVPEGSTLKLNTYFFNVSAQGNTANVGRQLSINQAELKRFLKGKPIPEKLKYLNTETIRKKGVAALLKKAASYFLKGEDGYPIAEDVTNHLLNYCKKHAAAVSIGCLSAKDRSGFTAARLLLRQLPKAVREIPDKQKSPWRGKILDPDWPAVQIARRNGSRALKVSAFPKSNLRGYGFIGKLALGINMAVEKVEKTFKGVKKERKYTFITTRRIAESQ